MKKKMCKGKGKRRKLDALNKLWREEIVFPRLEKILGSIKKKWQRKKKKQLRKLKKMTRKIKRNKTK